MPLAVQAHTRSSSELTAPSCTRLSSSPRCTPSPWTRPACSSSSVATCAASSAEYAEFPPPIDRGGHSHERRGRTSRPNDPAAGLSRIRKKAGLRGDQTAQRQQHSRRAGPDPNRVSATRAACHDSHTSRPAFASRGGERHLPPHLRSPSLPDARREHLRRVLPQSETRVPDK